MKKKLSMALALALASMAAGAQNPGAETIIRQQPAGTLHDNYARSSYYFYTSYSGALYGLDCGLPHATLRETTVVYTSTIPSASFPHEPG